MLSNVNGYIKGKDIEYCIHRDDGLTYVETWSDYEIRRLLDFVPPLSGHDNETVDEIIRHQLIEDLEMVFAEVWGADSFDEVDGWPRADADYEINGDTVRFLAQVCLNDEDLASLADYAKHYKQENE